MLDIGIAISSDGSMTPVLCRNYLEADRALALWLNDALRICTHYAAFVDTATFVAIAEIVIG